MPPESQRKTWNRWIHYHNRGEGERGKERGGANFSFLLPCPFFSPFGDIRENFFFSPLFLGKRVSPHTNHSFARPFHLFPTSKRGKNLFSSSSTSSYQTFPYFWQPPPLFYMRNWRRREEGRRRERPLDSIFFSPSSSLFLLKFSPYHVASLAPKQSLSDVGEKKTLWVPSFSSRLPHSAGSNRTKNRKKGHWRKHSTLFLKK